MTKKIIIIISLSFLLVVTACGSGNPEDSGQGIFVDDNGIAVAGADVVAYFSLDGVSDAVSGSADYEFLYKGAVFRFSNEENLNSFKANPEAFLPRYGGYCAYAMSQDKLVGIDPNAWTVRDGELFLNASLKGRKKWREDIPGYIGQADTNWPDWYRQLTEE